MMLQGVANSGDAADNNSAPPHDPSTTAAAELASSGFSEDEKGRVDDGGRNSGGNRWPRQETLALLKIRSDMDAVFRDSSLKGPLWDEVSRKLAELGYHRSAKKCKEKFENVYKYHKRTKEGRTSKADGKAYRFFDQLQALEGSPSAGSHHHQQQQPLSLPPPPPPPPIVAKPTQVISSMPNTQIPPVVTPTAVTPIGMTVSQPQPNNVDPISVAAPAVAMPTMNINHVGGFPFSQLNVSASTNSNSSSSSTSSEGEPPEKRRNRKRKWKEFFGKLMKEVIDKQEELQSKFLDTLERRERDRMAREEAWRMQEMAKMKREHELLVQERSMVAAKDAAVITFLQKITEQNPNAVVPQMSAMQLLQQQQQNHPPPTAPVSVPVPVPVSVSSVPPPPQPTPPMQQQTPPIAVPPPAASAPPPAPSAVVPVSVPAPVAAPSLPVTKNLDNGGGGDNMLQPSPSRWPKAEINALINLRTTLDTKYQESGPKGPLWEEISAAMRKLGYNRNAKRCKEKWENINKYYKKVKESSKKRPEDSKTCPYFHQLDAIYREKAANASSSSNNKNNNNPGFLVKPETQMAPIMARPEQQWPLPAVVQEQQQQQHQHHQQQQQQQQQSKLNETRGIQDYQNNEDDYDDEDDDEDDEDDEEEGGDYEIVPNKTSSMTAAVE